MLVAALLITLFASAPAQTQTAREIARESFLSVVMIIAKQPNGKTVSLGSGFFIEPGVIATAYHVVKGASALYAKGVGERQLIQVRVVALDAKKDLALLGRPSEPRIPPFSEFEATLALRGLPLGDSSAVEVGEEVYAVGNPEGLEGTFSQGIISGIRRVGDRDLIQITAPISHGSSGGPVLNKHGQVVGIAVGAIRTGQNLNFAIPASQLQSLVEGMQSKRGWGRLILK
jgi:S1-C subfamily serine protease